MKLFKLCIYLSVLAAPLGGYADSGRISFRESDDLFVLENDFFKRVLKFDKSRTLLETSSYIEKDAGYDFIRTGGLEFSFDLNGTRLSGVNGSDFFAYSSHAIEIKTSSTLLSLYFDGKESGIAENLKLTIFYEVYDDVAVVRKWLQLSNEKEIEVTIDNLIVESLVMDLSDAVNTWVYGDFCRYAYKMPYTGGKNDPAILVEGSKGVVVAGNEAPGIMKYTGIGVGKANLISIGMTAARDPYAFKYVLNAGDTFTAPKSFILVSGLESHQSVLDNKLDKFIRNHLGVKLFNRTEKPHFLYNTWNPFRTNINETIIKEVADALEGTGVEYLIIDDGWQDNYGDWNAHPENFPGGIEPVMKYIRERGMKPGLWITLFTAHPYSQAYKDCQDCAVTDEQGQPTNLHGHSAGGLDIYTMDIFSPWYDYIMDALDRLVGKWGAEYLKLDLAMLKSAYVMNPATSGSYKNNDFYRGREDYLYKSYERMLEMFDVLAEKYPKLIIDCTYEIWGDHQSIDYALVKHADVDWISNFFRDPPQGSRDVRWLAWHHGGCMPTSPMMIGNQQMDVENHQFSFLSNFASIPMMLGDPRKLTEEEKQWYQVQSDWFREMDEKYEIIKYYQSGGVLGQPSETNWDGFMRYNDQKKGGIFCVFRNDSPENTRSITIPMADEHIEYKISDSSGSDPGIIISGKSLKLEGISITIEERNSGKAFEIRAVD